MPHDDEPHPVVAGAVANMSGPRPVVKPSQGPDFFDPSKHRPAAAAGPE